MTYRCIKTITKVRHLFFCCTFALRFELSTERFYPAQCGEESLHLQESGEALSSDFFYHWYNFKKARADHPSAYVKYFFLVTSHPVGFAYCYNLMG